jgi:hypothetical protein
MTNKQTLPAARQNNNIDASVKKKQKSEKRFFV